MLDKAVIQTRIGKATGRNVMGLVVVPVLVFFVNGWRFLWDLPLKRAVRWPNPLSAPRPDPNSRGPSRPSTSGSAMHHPLHESRILPMSAAPKGFDSYIP